jgi:chloride channel protein, CIC family
MPGRPRSAGTARAGAAALALGAAAALAVWLFKRMIEAAEWVSHGWRAESWSAAPPLLVLLVPVAGGLLVGLILHRARVPEEPGHGVEEVIEAVTLGIREFPERRTPLKASVAALSLGSGAALGPEDPAIEIGGSLGHFLGRKAGLDHDTLQALVAAGAAGGLAAAFLAPLAAVVFAVEAFALRLVSRTTLLAAVAALTAFAVTRLVSPAAEPAVPALAAATGWELLLCLGLGVALGGAAAGQIRLMYTVEHAFIRWRGLPRWAKPACGGALIGVSGLFLPQLLGVGYPTLESVLRGEAWLWYLLVALALGKALLMAVSFGSGFLGGFFAPSFFIGATLGAAFGLGVQALVPGAGSEPAVFATVGMAAFLAGAVRAPVAAVLLVPALSGSYALVPALLTAALGAYVVSRWLEPDSLYTYGIDHPASGGPGRRVPRHPQSDVDPAGRSD